MSTESYTYHRLPPRNLCRIRNPMRWRSTYRVRDTRLDRYSTWCQSDINSPCNLSDTRTPCSLARTRRHFGNRIPRNTPRSSPLCTSVSPRKTSNRTRTSRTAHSQPTRSCSRRSPRTTRTHSRSRSAPSTLSPRIAHRTVLRRYSSPNPRSAVRT